LRAQIQTLLALEGENSKSVTMILSSGNVTVLEHFNIIGKFEDSNLFAAGTKGRK